MFFNPPSFGYTWGFADNSRADSVVEISPNINYTVSEAIYGILVRLTCGMIKKLLNQRLKSDVSMKITSQKT
ncbi:hypothetical protein Bhyg_01838 [Pseudolycoriella hygida]|uniref:Uncharacterized protein n=1 Tax=Pseudolycoriella hygida TaxID=35572 RepID=A0A9Q0S7U0_9DIPT|nr:hypothetical protein Bhyg_01838 [Pseudolycoriella hygida]